MRKFNLLQKILILILSIVFIVTLLFGVLKSTYLREIDKDVFNVFSSIRYTIFERPVEVSTQWVESFIDFDALRSENDSLRENISGLAAYQARISELERQNKELKSLLDLKNSSKDYEFISGEVIFRDFERWNNVIKINIGKNDGVSENDAVVVAEGLIGRVESTDDESSLVRLIISNEKVSKVAIKVELEKGKTVEGIIDEFDADRGMYKLSLLDRNEDIKKGNRIVTSGAGGTIPGGINVGVIAEVEPSVNQLADDIFVHPSVDFRNFETVFVVKER